MKTVVWFGFVLGALCAASGQVTVTKPGQSITLTCGVNSFKSSLKWLHGDNLIVDTGGRYPRKGSTPTAVRSTVRQTKLIINMVQKEDAGKFTCMVDGSTYYHTLLVVSVSASPSGDLQLGSEVTLQCQVKGPNKDPTVQWTRPDGSPHTGSQTIQLKAVANSDSGTWKCTFSYDDVTHVEDLQIKVKEPDPITPAPDPSRNTKDSRVTKRPANRPSDPGLLLGLSWWMWVVIGVGCLVVVLLTILVICLCKRVRRRRRKLQRMKNNRQLLMTKQYCQCNHPTAAEKPQQRRRREKPSALPLHPVLLE